ncbi:MAG: leucyl/phenylalanyl-tRNA--protein transferase [Phycisphaerales bacterium]|nr:leucyl/phenylalanyl-tRNA--protein transferase [Phycisphaerales bacterium]
MDTLTPSDLAEAMLRGYAQGIFAMDGPEGLGWYDPDPRAILGPEGLHVSRSLRQRVDSGRFELGMDGDPLAVIGLCARAGAPPEDTWITPLFHEALQILLGDGWVHSIEVHRDGALVGGLYGIHMNGVFFAESMVSLPPAGRDASKVALVKLVEHCHARGIDLIDCQFLSEHLASLGFIEVPRRQWRRRLHEALMTRASWRD